MVGSYATLMFLHLVLRISMVVAEFSKLIEAFRKNVFSWFIGVGYAFEVDILGLILEIEKERSSTRRILKIIQEIPLKTPEYMA